MDDLRATCVSLSLYQAREGEKRRRSDRGTREGE